MASQWKADFDLRMEQAWKALDETHRIMDEVRAMRERQNSIPRARHLRLVPPIEKGADDA